MKTFSKEMKSAITRILKKHEQLEKFNTQDGFHLRLEQENFLPLVIKKHNKQITITHYRSKNGDLIADPDMEFLVGPDANWSSGGVANVERLLSSSKVFRERQRLCKSTASS